MELVHIHVHREEGSREKNVFASESHRTPDRHPGHFASHELGDKRLIRVETAGRENHRLGVDRLHSLRSLHLDAGDLSVLHQDLRHAVIEAHVDMILIRAFAEHTHDFDTDRRTVARTMTAGTGLAAAATHAVAEFRAKRQEPLFSARGVFGQRLQKRRVIEVVAAFHRVGVENGRRIVRHAVRDLLLRAGRVHAAFRAVGVAAEVGHLLKDDHLRAALSRGDGGREPRAARTHDHDVSGFSRKSRTRDQHGKSSRNQSFFHLLSSRFIGIQQ